MKRRKGGNGERKSQSQRQFFTWKIPRMVKKTTGGREGALDFKRDYSGDITSDQVFDFFLPLSRWRRGI